MTRLRGAPHTIKIFDSFDTALPLDEANPGRAIDVFVIVLEFASGGDVMSRIEDFLKRKVGVAKAARAAAAGCLRRRASPPPAPRPAACSLCARSLAGALFRARGRQDVQADAAGGAGVPQGGRRAPRPEARKLFARVVRARRRRQADRLWPVGHRRARRRAHRGLRLRLLHRARNPQQDGLQLARRCVSSQAAAAARAVCAGGRRCERAAAARRRAPTLAAPRPPPLYVFPLLRAPAQTTLRWA